MPALKIPQYTKNRHAGTIGTSLRLAQRCCALPPTYLRTILHTVLRRNNPYINLPRTRKFRPKWRLRTVTLRNWSQLQGSYLVSYCTRTLKQITVGKSPCIKSKAFRPSFEVQSSTQDVRGVIKHIANSHPARIRGQSRDVKYAKFENPSLNLPDYKRLRYQRGENVSQRLVSVERSVSSMNLFEGWNPATTKTRVLCIV